MKTYKWHDEISILYPVYKYYLEYIIFIIF